MMNWCFEHKSDVSQNPTNDYETKNHFRFEAKKVSINKAMLTISIQSTSTKDQKHKSNYAIHHNKTE